jgi:hypothetical protein
MGSVSRRIMSIKARIYLKNKKAKKTEGVAQVVEHMPSQCQVLSLNPSTAKNKTRQNTLK